MKKMLRLTVLLFVVALDVVILCACNEQKKANSSSNVIDTTASQTATEQKTTAEPTTAEPTTEQITEEPSTAAISSEWKDIYINYIYSIDMGAGMEKFALIDVDGNGIPELFYSSGFEMGGGSISTVSQGQINTIRTGSGGIFYWNSRISCIGGRQGRYAKKVFDISGGTFQCVFDGTERAQSMNFDMDNPSDFTYSYRLDENSDYQDASYDEYNSAFLNVFRESEKTLVNLEYDRAAVFDVINNY